MSLPACPCCGEDSLWTRDYQLENGELHYMVTCHGCGVEFHHEKFYGYNGVEKFFDGCAGGECENLALEGMNSWLCSECGSRRFKQNDEDDYAFCPDCGSKVSL